MLDRTRPPLERVETFLTRDEARRARRWTAILRSTLAHMKMNRVNIAAGAFAYRWFLAIFPIIIALLGIATLVTVSRTFVLDLLHGVTKSLPSGAAAVFTGAISHATQRSSADLITTVVACVVALWSATSGMVIVEEGLDMAYDLPRDRSFLSKRLVALPLLLGATVLGSAASALIIFGPQLGHVIKDTSPIGGTAFSAVWTVLRFLMALGLMNLLMSVLYYVAPNRARARWRWFSPGALIATILWALVSWGFSFYTSSFGSYGNTYGAFAGVAILIFWLYLTGLAILVGGEVNAAIERLGVPADEPTAALAEAPPTT
ncbi:MAG TPA: YihY/virulence factor BrkB family protein [Acidimicrobiales bacterium]|nr:YihY/virulence factor BrkB family protein [Acidimicrobiales bacterium]